MITLRKSAPAAAALGGLLTMVVASTALATHPRPSTATPLRVPLILAFDDCFAPNSAHVAPLDYDSCDPATVTSQILTAGNAAGAGFAKMNVFCTNAQVPPCTGAAGDQEDIQVTYEWTDARCAPGTAGLPGCSADGADYTGSLLARQLIRITDHANGGIPGGGAGAVCASGTGAPPCVTATVEPILLGIPIPCVADANSSGGDGNLSTTLDALIGASGGLIKESQRSEISVESVKIYDAGADGDVGVTPAQSRPCPPACGTFDEGLYLEQGVFAP